jgi:hypothetical protein
MRIRCIFLGHDWLTYRVHADHNQRRDCMVCGKHQKGYRERGNELEKSTMWLTLNDKKGRGFVRNK